MSSQADDDAEHEANVDLKGVIKDLADQIDILNKALAKFSQGMGQGSKDFHKTHGEKLAEIAAQGRMVQQNMKLRKSLQGAETSMDMFTGMMKKGVTQMLLMETIGRKLGGVTTEFDDMKAKQKAFNDFNEKHMTKNLGADVNRPLLEQKKQLKADADESKEKYDKNKGSEFQQKLTSGMSRMGKFADKHAQGMIIGAGSAIILIEILKKALSASPMFQQMMKLLNFGIMMVLRPIGDFFGFLFRPILIMLLRKFIIPWYTKMYPVMMKMGNIIGEKLSGAFEALAKGDVAGAFAILFKDVDFKQILTDMTQGIRDWIDNTNWEQVQKDIGAALIALGTGIWEYVLEPLGSWIYDELKKWWEDGLDNAYANFSSFYFIVMKWFKDGVKGIETAWTDFWDGIWKWFDDGITGITTTWNDFFTGIKDWFITGITNAQVAWGDFWNMIKDAIWTAVTGLGGDNKNNNNNNNQTDKEPWNPFGWITGAKGARITEPIAGVGRSGQKYLFGEAGNETVVPDDQLGGGNITINIQNMSGSQQDLNNLRQVILDVVQESSARRGRA